MWVHDCDNCGAEDIADHYKECCKQWLCPNCNDNIHPGLHNWRE